MRRHLYFDLDGTLTDPFVGITRSILYALDAFDAPHPDHDRLRECIGPPLQVTFAELLGSEHAAKALQLYRERFADVGWRENVPYDGIHDTLAALAGAGYRMFVATTKPHVFARKIVEHFGLADYFAAVYGSELDGTRIDKTELLAWALPQHPDHDSATMIGDRKHDMIGAVNNRMDAIGVTWGYGSADELTTNGAARLIDAPTELRGALN